ncbi:MAG TPA: metalloregulator ArsR/SmtB family transcription factor [Paracoccaceae bacterium]
MPKQHIPLDPIFHALADPTRRAVLARLADGPATVSDLAAPFGMALPSFTQHLRVLEDGGLIRSEKQGRSRVCSLQADRLAAAEDWLTAQRSRWSDRFDRLGRMLNSFEEPST